MNKIHEIPQLTHVIHTSMHIHSDIHQQLIALKGKLLEVHGGVFVVLSSVAEHSKMCSLHVDICLYPHSTHSIMFRNQTRLS